MNEDFFCQSWCVGGHEPGEADCEIRFRLYDRYVPGPVTRDAEISPEELDFLKSFAAAASLPPRADLISLFALGDPESNAVDVEVELWKTDPIADEPFAVAAMDLQGLRDFHQELGRAIEMLEG